MSALAGGDCIDDADALRAGGTATGPGLHASRPPPPWARSCAASAGATSASSTASAASSSPGPGRPAPDPAAAPFTIDLDSTICETYGLAKEGGVHHGYTDVRGYHPLLAVAAGTGDVLMARLREGRANTVRGAAHFLRETIGRVRCAGATGELTMRADSGFYAHDVVAVCRAMDVRFSITLRQHGRVRRLIEAIPETAWTPIPYWIDGGADVAETTLHPVRRARRTRGPSG